MPPITSNRERLEALRDLLERGEMSTQDELRKELEDRDFVVTQSTISRDLRRLGATRAIDPRGRTVYRLPDPEFAPPPRSASLYDMLLDINSNGSVIVIHTAPGSASLVARHLDQVRPGGILGTVAGDDTIFVAPASLKNVKKCMKEIEDSLRSG